MKISSNEYLHQQDVKGNYINDSPRTIANTTAQNNDTTV